MSTLRLITLTVAVCAAIVTVAGCGGDGDIILQGTFTDLSTSFTTDQPCQAQETQADSNYHITVAVDNVPDANVPVIWHGNAYAVDGTVACAGTWSASVRSAQIAYQIRMTGNDGFGFQGTDNVSYNQAKSVIALSNAAT